MVPAPTRLDVVRFDVDKFRLVTPSGGPNLVYQFRASIDTPEFWNEAWASADIGPLPEGEPVTVDLTVPQLSPPTGLSIGVIDPDDETPPPPPSKLYFFVLAYDRSLPPGEQASAIFPGADPGQEYVIGEWVPPEPVEDPAADPASNQAVVRETRVELWKPFVWFPTPWGKFTLYIGKQLEEEV